MKGDVEREECCRIALIMKRQATRVKSANAQIGWKFKEKNMLRIRGMKWEGLTSKSKGFASSARKMK